MAPTIAQATKTKTMTITKMRATVDHGAEFWNDSCSERELQEAVDNGATGATSNPVIVATVVKNEAKALQPALDALIAANATANEDEVAWLLIEELGRKAANPGDNRQNQQKRPQEVDAKGDEQNLL